MFFIIDYKRGAYFNLFSHLPFRMDSFVDGNIFSFCYSIDWCVQYMYKEIFYIVANKKFV